MKRILKAYRIPEPLAEALRLIAFSRRVEQTQIVVDAIATEIERNYCDGDPRIASYLQEYRAGQPEESEPIPGETL